MRSIISYVDFLSPKPEIKIKGNRRFQTILGAIFSILIFLLILSFSIYFFFNFLIKQEKNIFHNLGLNLNFSIDMNTVPYTLQIVDKNGLPFPNASRIFTIKTYYDSFLSEQTRFNFAPIEITNEYCSFNTYFLLNSKIFSNVENINQNLCPQNGQRLILFNDDNHFSKITHYVYKCKNDTNSQKHDCFSQETIDLLLNSVYINYKSLDYTLNHSNIEQPFEQSLKSDFLHISSATFKRHFYNLRPIEYNTDFGVIFESKEVQFSFSYLDSKESTHFSNLGLEGSPVAAIDLNLDAKKDTYSRNFMKLHSLLAYIGGVTQALLIFSEIIIYLLTYQFFYLELIASFFQINSNEIDKNNQLK
jgi:hypothetical protein